MWETNESDQLEQLFSRCGEKEIHAKRPWDCVSLKQLSEPTKKKKRGRSKFEIVQGDPPEWVQRCLHCDFPECNNCLKYIRKPDGKRLKQ